MKKKDFTTYLLLAPMILIMGVLGIFIPLLQHLRIV